MATDYRALIPTLSYRNQAFIGGKFAGHSNLTATS